MCNEVKNPRDEFDAMEYQTTLELAKTYGEPKTMKIPIGNMSGEIKLTNEKEETQFQVGDIVSAFGLKGVVTKIAGLVFVEYSDGQRESFTQDGREKDFHVEPSLKLISRPKPERKVEVTKAMLAEAWNKSVRIQPYRTSQESFAFDFLCKQLGLEE